MKPNHTQAAIFRKLLGVGLLALALLGAVSLGMKEIPLALFGEHATGLVTKVEVIQTSSGSSSGSKSSSHGPGYITIMHLSFTTKGGQPVETKTTATFHTEAKVGDTHPMVYLPSHPENAKIYSAKQLWLPMSVGFVFVGVCSFLGQLLVRRKKPAV